MKIKGFGAWPSRNVSEGGRPNSFDAYNKRFKGGERFPRAEEYASRGVEEYHHYQEQLDLTAEDEQQDERREKEKQKKESKRLRTRIVQQFVVMVAGSLIITSTYQAQVAKREQGGQLTPEQSISEQSIPEESTPEQSFPPEQSSELEQTFSVSWRWSEDGTNAVLVIKDSSGKVVSEEKTTVTTTESPAGCRTEGKRTSAASITTNGKSYSDTHTVTLPALGHDFDEGTPITLEDGSTAMEFECTRCHEHFVIKNSVTEE